MTLSCSWSFSQQSECVGCPRTLSTRPPPVHQSCSLLVTYVGKIIDILMEFTVKCSTSNNAREYRPPGLGRLHSQNCFSLNGMITNFRLLPLYPVREVATSMGSTDTTHACGLHLTSAYSAPSPPRTRLTYEKPPSPIRRTIL